MYAKKDDYSDQELEFFGKLDMYAQLYSSGAKAAESLGISEATWNSYRYRLRHPKLATVSKLLPLLDDAIGTNYTREATRVAPENSSQVMLESSSVRVPVIGEVGAGMPVELWEQEPIEYISIMPEYMRPELRVFRVSGDSMAPTIKKGAYVGVTPLTDMFLKEGQIYLCFNPPFGIVVKRVKPASGNKVVLLSDNPSYDPITINLEEYPKVVVGEVRWVMQSV